MRLVAVVLATGILGLGLIGGSTALRLQQQLSHQAAALGALSEEQLARRLDGEAQLARARIEVLGADTASRLRQIAQRADVARAVASNNDVTIRDLLSIIASTTGFERLIAFDETGRVIGANKPLDLLALNRSLEGITVDLGTILKENSRAHPRGQESTLELKSHELSALGLPQRHTIAHTALEPVFDDFGDLIGAVAAIRPLARMERTLENFTSLANAGVVIMTGNNEIVSSAGPKDVSFSDATTRSAGLHRADDGNYVARCVEYEATLKVCTFASASLVTTTRDQMFQIGESHTRSLMWQFLASAALTLAALIVAMLVAVKHFTKGLSELARTAQEIAGGNLDVAFQATGIGEVRSLGLAFERMLTHLQASTRKIRQLAFYDAVSRIPNREKMRIDAPALIGATTSGALFFLDLDGFKSINDTFGHKAGDELLSMVADRLSNLLTSKSPTKTLLARVGGDEFVAIIAGVDTLEAARLSAREMIETLQCPFKLQSNHATIGVSIGIAIYPADGRSYDDLLIRADLAMYVAKNAGRNTHAFFTSDLIEDARARHALEADLALAIRNEELSVRYQPKVSCLDGRIVGVEALARWQHPTRGEIPPHRFIKIAEEIGLIMEIDRFVLRRALVEVGDLIRAGSKIVLAVNVAATDIEDAQFIKSIVTVVRETDFPAEYLEFEVTESIAMRNAEVVRERISLLRKLGIRFAMDDFGAGYSNLSTMASLPFDTVKLDRTLAAGVSADREKQTILRLALRLADELGFETVVEGVETAEDLWFVAENGATMVQGYIFSPPVSLDEFAALLQPKLLPLALQMALKRAYAERQTGAINGHHMTSSRKSG